MRFGILLLIGRFQFHARFRRFCFSRRTFLHGSSPAVVDAMEIFFRTPFFLICYRNVQTTLLFSTLETNNTVLDSLTLTLKFRDTSENILGLIHSLDLWTACYRNLRFMEHSFWLFCAWTSCLDTVS